MPPASAFVLTRVRRAFAVCALVGSLAVVLSACGSSGSSAAGGSNASSGSSATSSSSRYTARVKLAQCMRAHGVNVPDPSASASGGAGPGGGGGQALRLAQQSPNFQTAINACAASLSRAFGFANISPAQRTQFQQAAVKFAQCMRAHNVNIPDPTGNSAGGFGIFRSIPSSERQSPAFQTAFKACSSNLPNGGRFGSGGGGLPSVGGPGA